MVMGEHAEFWDFSVINLPQYDAILGKAWLDRWNPIIDWNNNTMQWKVGSRLISVTRVNEPQDSIIASNLFEQGITVDQISIQRMKKLAKRDSVFLALVRTTNEND